MDALLSVLVDSEGGADCVSRRQPIDVESLLQWAVSRSGRLPWMRDSWRELTLNPYTARPRRRPPANWTLAVAYAGQRFVAGYGRPALMVPGDDAALVLKAIATLGDPALSEQVRVCARARIRPDWMPGVEPVRVYRMARSKSGHRRRPRGEWSPCSPAAVAEARASYTRWRGALVALERALSGRLDGWEISGIGAPHEPWLDHPEVPPVE